MIKNIFPLLYNIYWTYYVKRHCTHYGINMNIIGCVEINGGGKITCGNDLFIKANRFNPVNIYVGPTGNLILGDKVFLNNRVRIVCSQEIIIGSHCDIADECLIIDNDFHGVGPEPSKNEPIIIEDDVWLASRVIVLKGVTIGKGTVIGAGSVVTKSIPPNTFAAGNPAKIIRKIK